jgi:hypothetical protein
VVRFGRRPGRFDRLGDLVRVEQLHAAGAVAEECDLVGVVDDMTRLGCWVGDIGECRPAAVVVVVIAVPLDLDTGVEHPEPVTG